MFLNLPSTPDTLVRVNRMLYNADYRNLFKCLTYLCLALVDEVGLLILEIFGEVTHGL